MREIREVIFKPFADPYGIVLVFNGPHRKEKLSLRFKDEKECRKWFDDLDNVRVALRNWDIAKGVGVVIAGALLGAAARRR
ncbi:hypothetical protein SARC_00586 [Sphaeroforma arctica JP610]|uniref:PH domain-containing protein n=1 Tax=Sphaeroforma arctica JP610 TaxID=667725 RepID=A0A0L0GE67_9EUKA|nr:hypothetical protein SARC_00586 [Sphaeroforma arctica JP610]KNC87305.1 hypothetical protein SARC_00586 [Sphaeroforma arctica JP610]|eukprot:XP_014161207.1 hypothetical protein SARC_00586 [Sphaeroforma arctica JP610]